MQKYFWQIVVVILVVVLVRKLWLDELNTTKRRLLPLATPGPNGGANGYANNVNALRGNSWIHEQTTPADVWIVPNFTGKMYPTVLVLDEFREQVTPDITHDPGNSRVIIIFSTPQTGTAVLS